MPKAIKMKFVATGLVELRAMPRRRSSGKPFATAQAGTTRLHAQVVKRILDPETGELLGWLYQWNTGEFTPLWKSEARDDVIYD